MQWLLLPRVMEVSEDIHKMVAQEWERGKKKRDTENHGGERAQAKRLRPSERLRVREP